MNNTSTVQIPKSQYSGVVLIYAYQEQGEKKIKFTISFIKCYMLIKNKKKQVYYPLLML